MCIRDSVSTVVTLGAGDATLAPITGAAASVLATHGEGDASITILSLIHISEPTRPY